FTARLAALFLGDAWDSAPYIKGEPQIGRAISSAFNNGLAYFDRYGKPLTTDDAELAAAFRDWNAIKAGSYMASVLRDVDQYHRQGALAFFADFIAADDRHRIPEPLAKRITAWNEEWRRVAEATRGVRVETMEDVAALEKLAPMLTAATVVPNYSADLVNLAQQTA